MFAVVVGAGHIGSHIVQRLYARGDKVAVIEKDAKKCDELSTRVEAMIFDGDGSQPSSYRSVEMSLVDMLFAVTDDDDVNLTICRMGKVEWGIPYVVVRANDPKRKEEFKELGADTIICPVEEALASFEAAVERHGVSIILNRTDLNCKIVRLRVPPNAVVVGSPIGSLRIRRDLLRDLLIPKGCRISLIIRRNQLIFPDEKTVIEADDQVIIMGSIQSVDEVVNLLRKVE